MIVSRHSLNIFLINAEKVVCLSIFKDMGFNIIVNQFENNLRNPFTAQRILANKSPR
jgi:hypothetical protein